MADHSPGGLSCRSTNTAAHPSATAKWSPNSWQYGCRRTYSAKRHAPPNGNQSSISTSSTET
uniref:Uncharacterized protein n=1 Tax=Physcomitrium patens TaxID=3218 RepID=A0A2K1KV72_PHYPA|nr:hypothetical protein PHYPA_004678 [Physcomitrium patens]